ncbi:hypothetical protein GCM10023215_18180 [Pseudonocardia yuanmonensis]|uniref:Pyruvate, water dikinase n=1 Tax=Pseudonocardia yuanmonensis TaxID=1095914 RepID=A0ABP8W974_9PSEU
MPDLVLLLDSPAATDLATAGGKGASLARARRAGLPVPEGFVVATEAYRRAAAGLPERPRPEDVPEVPAEVAAAVRVAYAALGAPPVAVRSSATAEDLPGFSFAGQQETVLDVRDADGVLDAVRRCWASLWGERAVAYRERAGSTGAETAVVVQELVPAECSGVLFTADPVTGETDRMLVDAAWGLGEAVVGGLVTPDAIVADAATGAVRSRRTAEKAVMTVRTGSGTVERPVPEERRHAPVLDDAAVAELVALGRRVADLYGGPTDVEWARAGGRFALLQARPVTTVRDPWNDSRGRDHLWTNGNLGEAVPGTVTPLTWSFLEIFSAHAMTTMALPGLRAYGRIGGRAYMDLSTASALAGLVGVPRGLFVRLVGSAFGRIPAGLAVPRAALDRRAARRVLLPAVWEVVRAVRREKPHVDASVAGNPARCAELTERVAGLDAAGLLTTWTAELRPLLVHTSTMLQVAGRSDPRALLGARSRLERLLGPETAAALATGGELESLGPVVGLARVETGELAEAEYLRRWGHRGPREFEVSTPRPAEDPAWVRTELARLRAAGAGPAALLERQRATREAAWARLGREHPHRVRGARRAVARWIRAAGMRERTRSEVVRVFGVLRAWALRAGEVTGLGDDVFFLELDALLGALEPDADLTGAAARAARNRAVFDAYDALPPYPAVIRGTFDPFAWAADPHRRADVWVAGAPSRPVPADRTGGTVTGFGGAAGIVEGPVRVLTDVAEGAALQPGEILVTTVTNVGWTPLFPLVAAVVTDVGAPLSHAAIVARELGLPAVVGCGDATTRLRTGDRVRVDGSAGTVTLLGRR